jgi:hypothetical protein
MNSGERSDRSCRSSGVAEWQLIFDLRGNENLGIRIGEEGVIFAGIAFRRIWFCQEAAATLSTAGSGKRDDRFSHFIEIQYIL